MTETATIELLTAEVRVLMVGSRQITLSVAKQLDHVDLAAIEPFGRVRIGDAEQIIGRSQQDGALVLANFKPITVARVVINDDELNPDRDISPIVCGRHRNNHGVTLRFEDRQILLYPDSVSWCGKHNQVSAEECGSWDPNGHEDYIRAAIAAWDVSRALHASAAALPLIVLAGLK